MTLNFPAAPADGDIYLNYVYDATEGVWNANPRQLASRFVTSATTPAEASNGDGWFNTTNGKTYIFYYDGTSGQWIESGYPVLGYQTLEGLTDTSFSTATAGEKLVFDGTNWVNLEGYVYVDTLYFASSGTFSKGDYPWLRAIRVKCVGAGGGAGGAITTSSGNISGGSGGGGGGYAESFIADIAGLASSVTVTRGAGGAGGTGASGSTGGNSVFGSITANGGGGGEAQSSQTAPLAHFSIGGAGGGASGAEFILTGSGGFRLTAFATDRVSGGVGGMSAVYGRKDNEQINNTSGNGRSASGVGNGGEGGRNMPSSGTARTGGAGANGIVIVELYA